MDTHKRNIASLRITPWLVAGLTIILGLAVSVFAFHNIQRTRDHMIRNYLEHAEALTWALEAGTRIGMGRGMRGGPGYFQSLVEETAKQNGIVYLAVTDGSGRILAHNDPDRIGSNLHDPGPMAALAAQAGQGGHFRTMPGGGKVFEVYKNFSPLPGVGRSMWCAPAGAPRGRAGAGRGQCARVRAGRCGHLRGAGRSIPGRGHGQ